MRCNDLSRGLVNFEAQKIWSRVVPDRVQHPLPLGDERDVELGHCHAFTFLDRFAHMLAFGGDDGGAASSPQAFLELLVRRDLGNLLVVEPSGGVDDEAARFQSMVADGDFHLLGEDRSYHGPRELGAVDLFVLAHQRKAGEGVVVLPAGQRTHTAYGGLDQLEAATVALSPDQIPAS